MTGKALYHCDDTFRWRRVVNVYTGESGILLIDEMDSTIATMRFWQTGRQAGDILKMDELFMVDWLVKGAGHFPTKNKGNYSDGNSAVFDQFDYEKNRIPLGRMHCGHENQGERCTR